MHQGRRSEPRPPIRIKDDPDDSSSFTDIHLAPGKQAAGRAVSHSDGPQQPVLGSDMTTQYHNPTAFSMHDFIKLDDPTTVADHPSPESDSLSLDDNDSMFSSASPPDAFNGSLPPHEETERYLRLTLGINPPQAVNLTALPESPWPPGITRMIKLAIWGSQRKMLTLSQIYDEIEKRFPARQSGKDAPWKKSIRHNLSLKSVFIKVERPANHPGKGCYWALDFRQGEGDKRPRSRKIKEAGTWNPEEGNLLYGSPRGPQTPYGHPVPLYPAGHQSTAIPSTLPGPHDYFYPSTGSSVGRPGYDPRLPMDYAVRTGPPFASGPQMRWQPAHPSSFPADAAGPSNHGLFSSGYGSVVGSQPLGETYLRHDSQLPHPYQSGQAFASGSSHSLNETSANIPTPVLPPRSQSYTRYEEDARGASRTSHRHRAY